MKEGEIEIMPVEVHIMFHSLSGFPLHWYCNGEAPAGQRLHCVEAQVNSSILMAKQWALAQNRVGSSPSPEPL